MLADNPLNNGEANAGSLELLGAVQALKDSESLVGVLHAKAHAVVAHKDG